MTLRNTTLGGAVTVLVLLPMASLAADNDAAQVAHEIPTVQVNDEAEAAAQAERYAPAEPSTSSTGLAMTLRETPQSISVISRAQMDDFGLNNVNDVLDSAPGVTVERVETDRTYYTARGFDIRNFQFDGIGLPLPYSNVKGNRDTALFERVEILRGANGLMSGVGNPSATVNFVRKRPTEEASGSLGLSYGSWDTYRLDADMSGSLIESGAVRGRLVTAYQDGNSYLDRYEKERGLVYGVVEADLTENTLLSLGFSRQEDKADSPMWGALPLYYQDGGDTDYSRSTSTSADWSFWDNVRENLFVELQHRFDNDWVAKASYLYNSQEGDSELYYVSGTPDRNNNGLFNFPSIYDTDESQQVFDLRAQGPFEVGGRVHELIIGANRAKGQIEETSIYGAGKPGQLTEDEAFGGSFPRPVFGGSGGGSDWEDRYLSGYLATRLNLHDRLAAVVGARYLDVDSKGEGYSSVNRTSKDSDLTPYAGLVYDLTLDHSLYASYTEIFSPQVELDGNGQRLDPVVGDNREVGVKSEWLAGKLNTALTAFWTKQRNLAEVANPAAPFGQQFNRGADFDSFGYELEVTGEVRPGWQISGGYAWLEIEDEGGDEQKPYIPRETLKLATSFRPQGLEALKMGMRLRWQESIHRLRENTSVGGKTRQGSLVLVDLMARYDITDNINATLNVNNVTDEKYLTSLQWDQGYYGAPRNATVGVNWEF